MASRSWNRVELIGNLTRDPELRYTPNGAPVATFSIATNRTYLVEGERKEEADFHRCVAWNKLAELCSQLLKKGIKVFVSGRLQNRSWEAQDGQTKQITEIVIEDMILLSNRSADGYDEPFGDEPAPSQPASTKAVAGEPASKPAAKVKESEDQPKAPKEDIDLEDLPF